MDIVLSFKEYLFSQDKPAGALTIKNYLADVRKFINWYEYTFHTPFSPELLNDEVVKQYQGSIQLTNENSLPAASSVKRYMSSLRKFTNFLMESGAIQNNPFMKIEKNKTVYDPFYFKSFKNFLSSQQASKLTIKNYLNDIKQFLDWLEQVTSNSSEAEFSSLLSRIDNKVLEEYKNRLFNEAKLSPISINRKLSSLRRYVRWLEDKHIIAITTQTVVETPPAPQPVSQFDSPPEPIRELPLTALRELAFETKPTEHKNYSAFAPVRLTQKTAFAINRGLDLLIFDPIAHSVEAIHYLLWKNGKKVVFAPVIDIADKSSFIPKAVSIKTIIPKQINMMPPWSASPTTILQKVNQYKMTNKPATVRNFTKALYAPLEISTEQMHWSEKLTHNLRYRRPEWYKAYHKYAFVNYIHYALLMFAAVFAGSALFQAWTTNNPAQPQAVLAAHTSAPPRILTFQGRLLDKTNTPISVETPLRFNLYNSPTATQAATLWQEKQDIKPDQNGYFTTTLGKIQRLDQSLFADNPSLYIGITIGDHEELLPRQQIPTTNYATDSQTVQGLKPITATPDQAQNVLLALDSSGNLTIGGTASHTFQVTGGQMTMSGQALLLTTNPGSNGNIQISPDGSGIVDIQKPIQNTSNTITPGGIAGAVEVDDIFSVLATTSSQSALVVNQNGSGDIISARQGGIDKFRLDNEGNAFLGGNIILNGDTIDTNSTALDIGGPTVTHLTIGSNANVLSLGAASGITSIRNSLSVGGTTSLSGALNAFGLITANAGLTIPHGQSLTFAEFTPGAIPFIGATNQVMQDVAKFKWNDSSNTLNVLGSICVNSVTGGTCSTTAGAITSKTLNTVGTADVAENYVSSENLEPGDVVAPEGLTNNTAIVKSTAAYQKNLIGIISTNPGVTLNSDAKTDYEHPNVYPLALQGRVPVKVSSINGPIHAGDELTSSSIPGVAMLANASGQTIGKALEGYSDPNPQDIGKIMVFVNLSYQSLPSINNSGNLTVEAKSQNQTPQNLQLNNDIPASSSANQTPEASSSGQLDLNTSTATPSSTIYNSIASPSATTSQSADTKTQTPSPLTSLISPASLPTNFAQLNNSGSELSYVPNFKADFATFNQGLVALGPTSLTDVAISGMVIINNNLKITSDSLDTIATDLNIQPLRQGNILFESGLVAIDTQGNLNVKGNASFDKNVSINGQLATGVIAPIPNHDLAINLNDKSANAGSSLLVNNASGNHVVQINQDGDVIASGEAKFNTIASQGFTIIRGAEADTSNTITVADGSGGTGKITAHQTERTIITPYVTSHSLIYVTATSNTGSLIPYVARQTPQDPQNGTKGSFTVEIPYTVSRDISFNWWIVN